MGIEDKDKERIFAVFQQKEGGFQRSFGGLGIGLAICNELVKTMAGTLSLESQPGTGTTFTLSLPVARGMVQKKLTSNHVLASSELPILIVEDDELCQMILIAALEKMGYRSIVANQGEEALTILNSNTVSLILMDLQMPVMDGFTCTKAIRQRGGPLGETPIIAVTANLLDSDKKDCLEAGMNGYLSKPVNFHMLQKTLAQYIAPSIQ